MNGRRTFTWFVVFNALYPFNTFIIYWVLLLQGNVESSFKDYDVSAVAL